MKRAFRCALTPAFFLVASVAGAAPTRNDAEACAKEISGTTLAQQHESPACARLLAAYGGSAKVPNWVMAGGPEGLRDLALTLPSPQEVTAALPDLATLPSLLKQIREERDARPLSLWERILRWLQQRPDHNTTEPAWMRKLAEWMKHIPPSAAHITFWSLFALLVVLLIALIVIELRASRVLRRRAVAATPAQSADPGITTLETALSLDDIDRLPLAARPGALLRWLLRALATRGALPADTTMTNRELARQLSPTKTDEFLRFIDCIEPVVYGDVAPREESVSTARLLAVALAESAPDPRL